MIRWTGPLLVALALLGPQAVAAQPRTVDGVAIVRPVRPVGQSHARHTSGDVGGIRLTASPEVGNQTNNVTTHLVGGACVPFSRSYVDRGRVPLWVFAFARISKPQLRPPSPRVGVNASDNRLNVREERRVQRFEVDIGPAHQGAPRPTIGTTRDDARVPVSVSASGS
jgi:hypothetical protein